MVSEKDIAFLQKFPDLNDWLNIHGFSLIYTARVKELQQIYTVWSDRSTAPVSNGCTDAQNWIFVVYCEECTTIEIYKRIFIGKRINAHGTARQMIDFLTAHYNTDHV